MSGVIVEVTSRRFAIPLECPCCGAAPDGELTIAVTPAAGRTVATDTARGLEFPYCRRCIEHVVAWESAGMTSAGAMVLVIVAAIVVGITLGLVYALALAVAGAIAAWVFLQRKKARAKAACGASCAAPQRAVGYLGWSGTESAFVFESHAYAARFAEQNAERIPNPSPQLRRLLDGHRAARLAVPTPAAAHVTVPPPATVDDWLGRLAAAAGVVARRSTVQRALDALHEPADRERILARAVELELAPVQHKLHDPDARKRAIAELTADNVPEELYAAAVRELERAPG
ncbi:MAG TPA: hypothetical protein VFQ53_33225 [Kofleriaceae bacterium]|nr:hypothetical protein [Kofleriaceae bacterium]